MMKSGAVHLDWVVSMGIFIVFLSLTLIYFKPGSEPAYNKDYLLPILENNIRNETYYSIERLPISAVMVQQGGIEYVKLDFAGNFPICYDDIWTADDFNVVDSSLQDVQFELSLNCNSKNGELILRYPSTIANEDNIRFYLLYSKDLGYMKSGSLSCIEQTQGEEEKNCEALSEFNIGVSEIVSGMSNIKLRIDFDVSEEGNDGGIVQKIANDYENIKSGWKYPGSKDFKVCIESFDDGNCYPNNTVKKVPGDANVFSREFKENMLNPNTELGGSVNINIRAW